MPENRFFLNQPFKAHEAVFLREDELHHLKVMKRGKDSHLELVNGQNQIAFASLLELHKDKAVLKIEKVITNKPAEKLIILIQALIKPVKLDFVVEKAIELGAHELVLFPSALSELEELSSNKQQRLQALAIAAMKQCGRLDLPNIIYLQNLEKALAYLKQKAQTGAESRQIQNIYFGDTDPNAPSLLEEDAFKGHLHAKKQIGPEETKMASYFFVGPEKGFTPEEILILKNQLKAKGVKLSKNILRTETAGMAAIALLAAL